jgi:hypothetical protein
MAESSVRIGMLRSIRSHLTSRSTETGKGGKNRQYLMDLGFRQAFRKNRAHKNPGLIFSLPYNCILPVSGSACRTTRGVLHPNCL